MRIVSIVIVICLLMTGCGRISDTSETPNSKENLQRIKGDDYKLLFSETEPRLTEDGIAKDKIGLYDSTGISMPEKYNVTIPEEAAEEYRKASNDLKRILIEKCTGLVTIYIVYDIDTERIIFRKEISLLAEPGPNPGRVKYHVFSPSLDKALYEDEKYNKVYLVSTITGEEILLSGVEKINIIDCTVVFSEDESKFAFISESDNGEKLICMYDLDSNAITSRIEIGKGNVYLSQWQSNKIMYNHEDSAYYADLETFNVHLIGQYMFYPLLSPDSRYLAFSKPEVFTYYDSAIGMGYFTIEDRGLYIMDLTNNETKKITTDLGWDYIPFLWFAD